MPTFADSAGREWDVRVTHAHLRPLKRECGIDLRDMFKPDGNTVADAVGDPEQVGRLAWLLCRQEAKSAGVTADQFAASLNGPAVWSAAEAIAQALLDFFPAGDAGVEDEEGEGDRARAGAGCELPDLEAWGLELAGVCGVDAGPLTLRELFVMARGAWDPFARVLSFIAAACGDKPRHPDVFNPYRRRPKSAEAKRLEHKEGMLALRTGLRLLNRGR